MGIEVKRDTVAKVFSRWAVKTYSSAFVSNLQRLDTLEEKTNEPPPEPTHTPSRKGDENFVHLLKGMRHYPLQTASPGLLTLWAYIEELGLFPLLDAMGLTKPMGRGKYSWFDVLLFDIARRFYGIPSLSAACDHESSELAFFAHLYKPPCNDTALNVLASIDEKQVRQIRGWLVDRLAQLGLATGRRVAFDFHHIDQDVQLPDLRNIGRGPSPKKKLCYTGFRPHICWDIDSGSLLAAEFRKSSARGTSTVKPFCREYILPTFRELFETVYIDSEYTGKHVWNFVLDDRDGMHAHLTGCLKQNALVRKARDAFLTQNAHRQRLWCYYDDDHVYANRTFTVQWSPSSPQHGSHHTLKLTCVVKKHVVTGKLRCFGTSKHHLSATQILEDYSSRWTVENGIKDLIASYFLDNCPGTKPHNVDVHFLSVSICRSLYRMIERDLGDSLRNSDGSAKTLNRMREALFRQGPARIDLRDDTLSIEFAKAYTRTRTQMLTHWLRTLSSRHQGGLTLLGGLKLNFALRPPLGEEYRNAARKIPLNVFSGTVDPE